VAPFRFFSKDKNIFAPRRRRLYCGYRAAFLVEIMTTPSSLWRLQGLRDVSITLENRPLQELHWHPARSVQFLSIGVEALLGDIFS